MRSGYGWAGTGGWVFRSCWVPAGPRIRQGMLCGCTCGRRIVQLSACSYSSWATFSACSTACMTSACASGSAAQHQAGIGCRWALAGASLPSTPCILTHGPCCRSAYSAHAYKKPQITGPCIHETAAATAHPVQSGRHPPAGRHCTAHLRGGNKRACLVSGTPCDAVDDMKLPAPARCCPAPRLGEAGAAMHLRGYFSAHGAAACGGRAATSLEAESEATQGAHPKLTAAHTLGYRCSERCIDGGGGSWRLRVPHFVHYC